ncbi:MAG TPA: hypothetical protein PLU53_15460, partial [Bacteroidia bacterium]|nr:hypothetical protein [Bacteroidia bacterium]
NTAQSDEENGGQSKWNLHTDLFKQRLTVYGTIQNQGGDGNFYVTFHAFQDGKDFKRTQQLFLRANQSEDAQATFDEVTRLGGDITYNIEVKSE